MVVVLVLVVVVVVVVVGSGSGGGSSGSGSGSGSGIGSGIGSRSIGGSGSSIVPIRFDDGETVCRLRCYNRLIFNNREWNKCFIKFLASIIVTEVLCNENV